MHGVSRDVPSNLGAVTYKTSLLHLQPRQMTLAIAELREDAPPVVPEPPFNPHLFSEDEEDAFHSAESATESPLHAPRDSMRRKLTLVDRPAPLPVAVSAPAPALARPESYEEFPYIDTEMTSTSVPAPMPPPAPGRHAISPLRCESSVPSLQSPKNAVAPTDVIFERPSPAAVACGGRGDFCGRAEYSSIGTAGLKGPLSVEHRACTEADAGCLSKLRKNICATDVNARILKSLCARSLEEARREDLRYIDEEVATVRQRTPTVVPISPAGAPPDTMTRSCSVGYLDLVDPLHAHVSVAALRGEPPRRLVLVDGRRRRRAHANPARGAAIPPRAPSLRRCGKSRSLDSSELPLASAPPPSSLLTCANCRRPGAALCRACAAPPPPPPAPAPEPRLATDSDSDYSKYYS